MLTFKLTELFFVTLFCIIVFARAYSTFFDYSISEAIYMSLKIQTIAGSSITTPDTEQKILMSFQYILAYFIVSGILIFSMSFHGLEFPLQPIV